MTNAPQPEPTILYCLGANKAGTSWLYRFLAGHPQCRMPVVKELHYFDARAFGRKGTERLRIARLLDRSRADLGAATGRQALVLRARVAELGEWQAVLADDRAGDDAYRAFLMHCGQGAKLIGDVTPAYALLPEAVLARMQALAGRVRFLYILRDPLDRLWSNIRMNAARAALNSAAVAAEALRMFDAWAAGGEEPVRKRSDYAGTLARLGRVILPANLSVIFYETLFTPEAVARLCGFLGLTPHPAEFGQLVHAGVPALLDAQRRARAQVLLAPQYDYVRRTLGDLPPRWRENMGEI